MIFLELEWMVIVELEGDEKGFVEIEIEMGTGNMLIWILYW